MKRGTLDWRQKILSITKVILYFTCGSDANCSPACSLQRGGPGLCGLLLCDPKTDRMCLDGQCSGPSRRWSVAQTKRGTGWVSQGSEDNKIRVSVCPEWGAVFDALTEWRSLAARPGILLAKASTFLWSPTTLAEQPFTPWFFFTLTRLQPPECITGCPRLYSRLLNINPTELLILLSFFPPHTVYPPPLPPIRLGSIAAWQRWPRHEDQNHATAWLCSSGPAL